MKSAFTGGADDIRLLNKQGGGDRKWGTATLFVLSEIGIVFGTPDMIKPHWIKDVNDAVILKKQGIIELMNDPSNVLKMEIRKKPPAETTRFSHKPSTAIAKQILSEEKLSALYAAFDSAAAPRSPLGSYRIP